MCRPPNPPTAFNHNPLTLALNTFLFFAPRQYDHFGFGGRETCAYNAFIFLAAMSHTVDMAIEVGDAGVGAAATAALARANSNITALLWEGDALGYYRAFSGGDAVFTDTLYGLMIAHAHGFGVAGVDAQRVASHLAVEWARNQDAFGMRVISNPIMEDSVWMNGPPTWTYLSLAQLADASPGGVISNATAFADALEPMRRMVSNYRDRIADLAGTVEGNRRVFSARSPYSAQPLTLMWPIPRS